MAVALIGPCRDSVDPHLQALASGYALPGIRLYCLTFVYRYTDADGRCTSLLASDARELQKDDVYTIIFHTKNYFEETGRTCFYPKVEVCYFQTDAFFTQ